MSFSSDTDSDGTTSGTDTDRDEFDCEVPISQTQSALHGWTLLDNRSAIQASSTSVDDFLLGTACDIALLNRVPNILLCTQARARKETAHVCTGLLRQLQVDRGDIDSISFATIVKLHLPRFQSHIVATSRCASIVNEQSLAAFLIVKLGEIAYLRPASQILSTGPALEGIFSSLFRVMPCEEYKQIADNIRVVPDPIGTQFTWQAQSDQVSHLRELERVFGDTFRYCHCPAASIVSLDDDKLRKLSKRFALFGLKKSYTRNSGACPVMHMLASVLTGVALGTRLDLPGRLLHPSHPSILFC